MVSALAREEATDVASTSLALTDIGYLPSDWEVITLGSAFMFQNGVNADAKNYGKGTRFANVLEVITHSHLYAADVPGRVLLPKGTASSFTVESGDLLFNRTSETQEELGLVSAYLDDEAIVFGGFVIRARPINNEFLSTYAAYAFRAPFVRSQIMASGQGAVRSNIGQGALRKVRVPRPTLKEQSAIVEALSDADALIVSLKHLIEKKRHIMDGAMQELLSGRRRLPGYNGRWNRRRLGEVADVVMGQSPNSRNYNTKNIGVPLIQGNADIVNRKTIRRVFTTELTKIGKCGDILMSVRAPVGEIARATFDICLGRGVCAIKAQSDFLYYALIAKESEWTKFLKGSTFESVTSSDVRGLELNLPADPAEQSAISDVLSDLDIALDVLENRLEKARQIKQGMMQELLTGRVRLV